MDKTKEQNTGSGFKEIREIRSFRLPSSLWRALTKEAEKEQTTLTWVIEQVLYKHIQKTK